MPEQRRVQEYLEWAKQKLNEVEAMLVSLDGSVEVLKKDARTEAECAIARIRTARDAFKAKVNAVRPDTAAAKAAADKVSGHRRRCGVGFVMLAALSSAPSRGS